MKKMIQGLAAALVCGAVFSGCSTFDFTMAAINGDTEGMISAGIDMVVEGMEMLQEPDPDEPED